MSEPRLVIGSITTGIGVWNHRHYPPRLEWLHRQTFTPEEWERRETVRGWHPQTGQYETPVPGA